MRREDYRRKKELIIELNRKNICKKLESYVENISLNSFLSTKDTAILRKEIYRKIHFSSDKRRLNWARMFV